MRENIFEKVGRLWGEYKDAYREGDKEKADKLLVEYNEAVDRSERCDHMSRLYLGGKPGKNTVR